MESLFLLGLVGLTSLAAYLAGTHWLALSKRALGAVAGRLLEWAGLTLVFFAVNFGIGIIGILGLRTLTGVFVPLFVNDAVVLVLSLLQALAFQEWRNTTVPSRRP